MRAHAVFAGRGASDRDRADVPGRSPTLRAGRAPGARQFSPQRRLGQYKARASRCTRQPTRPAEGRGPHTRRREHEAVPPEAAASRQRRPGGIVR